MNKLFFKDTEGRYHYGIGFEDISEAAQMAMEFVKEVPSIMVTDSSDYSVFEAENGVVVFPENMPNFPRQGLSDSMSDDESILFALISQRNDADPSSQYWRVLEATILACAAKYKVDVRRLGWSI